MTTKPSRSSRSAGPAAGPAAAPADATDDERHELEQRASLLASRIARVGIPKQELARLAGIDRGTLGRALKADPRTLANGARTWTRIERELERLEEEFGLDVELSPTASGETVTSTVEYERNGTKARITVSGKADAVARALREVLEGGASDD